MNKFSRKFRALGIYASGIKTKSLVLYSQKSLILVILLIIGASAFHSVKSAFSNIAFVQTLTGDDEPAGETPENSVSQREQKTLSDWSEAVNTYFGQTLTNSEGYTETYNDLPTSSLLNVSSLSDRQAPKGQAGQWPNNNPVSGTSTTSASGSGSQGTGSESGTSSNSTTSTQGTGTPGINTTATNSSGTSLGGGGPLSGGGSGGGGASDASTSDTGTQDASSSQGDTQGTSSESINTTEGTIEVSETLDTGSSNETSSEDETSVVEETSSEEETLTQDDSLAGSSSDEESAEEDTSETSTQDANLSEEETSSEASSEDETSLEEASQAEETSDLSENSSSEETSEENTQGTDNDTTETSNTNTQGSDSSTNSISDISSKTDSASEETSQEDTQGTSLSNETSSEGETSLEEETSQEEETLTQEDSLDESASSEESSQDTSSSSEASSKDDSTEQVTYALSKKIEQFGITWTFDANYPIGQFANGDYWVVGPVTIIGISPKSTDSSGRIKNGSMINPSPKTDALGYDSATRYNPYKNSLNVAYGVSPESPLTLSTPCSLVSTISESEAGHRPQLRSAAILTVLSEPAPDGSFRPAYCGQDKSVQFNEDDLNTNLLQQLSPVSSTPSLETVENFFERPWLDHKRDWVGRYIHPSKNMPDYGREMATEIGVGALMLHLNFTVEQKKTLLVRYVQLGIDLYGIVADGGRKNWVNNGGHAQGRKWPILFAGLMLDDPDMKTIGQKSGDYILTTYPTVPDDYIHFGEDDQTFYVTQYDINITHSTKWNPDKRDSNPKPYTEADLGLVEWGIRHATEPWVSNRNVYTAYRQVVGPSLHGFVLAARIMYARNLWNHDALFDYTDRYMTMTAPGGGYNGTRSHNKFTENMWDIYRDQFNEGEE